MTSSWACEARCADLGLKVGKTTPKTFENRVRSLVADHPTLLAVADALLRARAMLAEQFIKLDKQLHVRAPAATIGLGC